MKAVRPASGLPVKRRMGWLAIPFLIAPALMASPAALADALQDYAALCDQAIGATVQDFDCDAGTEVPGQGSVYAAGAMCDEPNRLNRECDPGSHFQVTRSDDAYVVGHCRKKGNASGEYGDIAVIQYNRKNGATCFYQALADPPLPGQVKAPSKGQSAWRWLTPSGTAHIACGGCHDNGPFIRSPYLNQLKGGPNALPGSDPSVRTSEGRFFNSDPQPYAFVGQDFASWKAFKVEIKGNECNDCHRLGVSNLSATPCGVTDTGGTALDFAERATSASEISDLAPCDAHKNPPSAASPIWMPPHPPFPEQVPPLDPVHAAAAQAIHDCAARFHVNEPLPNTDSCRITQFAPPLPPSTQDLTAIYYLLDEPPTQDLTSIYYLILDGQVP